MTGATPNFRDIRPWRSAEASPSRRQDSATATWQQYKTGLAFSRHHGKDISPQQNSFASHSFNLQSCASPRTQFNAVVASSRTPVILPILVDIESCCYVTMSNHCFI